MKIRNIFASWTLITLLAPLAGAQIVMEEEVIYTKFQPKLAEVERYSGQPAILDTFQPPANIRYEVNNSPIKAEYVPDTIQAARMKAEPISKIQRFYLKAGFGNYVTPLAEFHINSLRSKANSYAFRYKHFSSRGNIGGYGFPGFSDNEVMGSYKHFLKNHTINLRAEYARNVVHYYGYNPAVDTLVREDSTRQRYSGIDFNASFASNYRTDSIRFNHRVDLNFYHLSDLYRFRENTFSISGEVNKFTDLFAAEFFGIRGGIQVLNYSNDSVSSSTTALGHVNPFMRLGGKNWNLHLGAAMFFGGGLGNSFGIYPEVYGSYKIFRKYIILYAEASGKTERNTFRNLTAKNPFLMSKIQLQNLRKYNFELGVRGAFSDQISYKLGAAYSLNYDYALFVNDTISMQRRGFNVVYDDVNILNFHGEIMYSMNEKLNISFRTNYNIYSTTKELEAWHNPFFDASISGLYSLGKKLIFHADIFVISSQNARIYTEAPNNPGLKTPSSLPLNWLFDLNLGAEYRLTKSLSFFLNLNNIGAIKYSRFYNYPTQGFNLIGGLTFGL